MPKQPELNIDRDLYYDHKIIIERKASLDEISGNLTQARDRFEKEMATYSGKKYLVIENSTYDDIVNQNYTTKFSPKAFLASIHTFNHRYNLEIMFMPKKEYTPVWIYGTLTYYLRNCMR